MGWNSHTMSGILTTADGNGIDLKIFDNYGQMRSSEITMNATTYVNEDTRQTKNNNQLYPYLKKSLTAPGTAKIIAESTNYHIVSKYCGDLLLKLLTQKEIIDTRDKASDMRQNLSSIDT